MLPHSYAVELQFASIVMNVSFKVELENYHSSIIIIINFLNTE